MPERVSTIIHLAGGHMTSVKGVAPLELLDRLASRPRIHGLIPTGDDGDRDHFIDPSQIVALHASRYTP